MFLIMFSGLPSSGNIVAEIFFPGKQKCFQINLETFCCGNDVFQFAHMFPIFPARQTLKVQDCNRQSDWMFL